MQQSMNFLYAQKMLANPLNINVLIDPTFIEKYSQQNSNTYTIESFQ